MNIVVKQTNMLQGTITVPSSKSHSVRGLLVAALAPGVTKLENVLDADDTVSARRVCEALGAELRVHNKPGASGGLDVEVASTGLPLKAEGEINTRDSGITTRFVLPLLGFRINPEEPVALDCSPQMRARPIAPLIKSLEDLGMKIDSAPGSTYPLKISGRLLGGNTTVDGKTSQYLSALMLALPLAEHNSVVTVENLHERPYAKMTARWLDEQSIKYSWEEQGERDIIKILGGQRYRPFNKKIPGDFSSASYIIVSGVLGGGEVCVQGLDFADPQGDKRLVEILKSMGADITERGGELVVRGGKKLIGIKIDCNDIPDMVPTLAVIATQASGKTELVNVPQARLKETDRLHSMTEGLRAMGAHVEEKSDGLVIYESKLIGAAVRGYGDHRTVMALALAGLVADGETTVDTAESINKTFPNFVTLMQSLGAKITKL